MWYHSYVRRHSPKVIDAIKKDRANGLSLSHLVEKYRIPKTSVWFHVKNIDLPPEIRKSIRSYMGGSRAEKVREWARAEKEASSILDNVDMHSAWPILYGALYWCEGTKGSFVFTNTDEKMIVIFLSILRVHFGVKNEDLDFMIRICNPMNPIECRKYWAEVASVPLSQIRINHSDTHNKSKTVYGMCRITLRKGAYHLKLVHCLFKTIADKMISLPIRPRSSMDRVPQS